MIAQILTTAVSAAALCGCAAPPRTRIEIPRHLRGPQTNANAKEPASHPGGDHGPYAVRISDNGRTYEISLPPVAGGYEVRVPLAAPQRVATTEQSEVVPSNGLPERSTPAFEVLLGKIRELFARKSYEIALFELDKLQQAHPDDPELLAMQGSIEWKRGNREKARELWEQAVELDYSNEAVLNMLGENASP